MPTVTDTVLTPGNDPDTLARIWVDLVGADPDFGLVTSTQETIIGRAFVRPDDAGVWEATLTANVLITPADTVYKVTVAPGDGPEDVYYIEVPNGAGPYWVGDILTTEPTSTNSPSTSDIGVTIADGLDYTGATDMTSALQALLDAAHDAQALIDNSIGGTVSLSPAEVWTLPGVLKVSGLDIPSHVRLVGHGTILIAAGSGYMVTSSGYFNGIEGFGFKSSGVGVGASGIHVIDGAHFTMSRLTFKTLAGRAMLVGGEAHTITNTYAESCLLDTASLAAKTGVLEVVGNAIRVYGDNEYAGGRSSLSSVNAYVCGVVATGTLNVFDGVYPESCDVGFYVNGSNQVFIGCVSDINAGHGWEFGGGGGQLVGCVSRWNSQDTGGTYDGFHVTEGTYIFETCQSYSPGPSAGHTQHAYGFQDVSSHNPFSSVFGATNVSVGHATAAFKTHSGVTGASVTRPQHPWVGVSTGTATPSVDGLSTIKLANGSAQNITNFTNGVEGQFLTVYGDGNSTLKASDSSFVMKPTNSDLLCASNVPYLFILGNGTWRQIA